MSHGRIYINEVEPTTATADFSASPAELLNNGSSLGFAFRKTLEHLGLEHEVDDNGWRATIHGSVETVQQHLPDLQRHIGLIARYGAERSRSLWPGLERNEIGRILGNLVQKRLPELPEHARLMRAIGLIAEPMADYVHDDGILVYYGHSDPSRGEDPWPGLPTSPFGATDIGGLLIDRWGNKVRQGVILDAQLGRGDVTMLRRIAEAKGEHKYHGTYHELNGAISGFLADPSPPTRVQEAVSLENARISVDRDLLDQLHDLAPADWESFNRNLYGAIRKHVAASLEDPDIQARIEEEEAKHRRLYGLLDGE